MTQLKWLPALLALSVTVSAADTPELDRLRSNYEKAIKPIRESYLDDLARLRDTYARAANLPAANRVQAEIDAVTRSVAMDALAKAAPAAPPSAPGAAANPAGIPAIKPPELKWIAGKIWFSPARTTWSFKRDGTGEHFRLGKLTLFTWRVLPSGIVQVDFKTKPDNPATLVSFIHFASKSEAWQGVKEDSLTNVLNCTE